ncbi:MAG TPA: SgcJ/EcaC family oxidoreductase [Pirellulales bacterium]|nr:SgcJ/EcaC family oxidoreductase [Pirellulales bacterium]
MTSEERALHGLVYQLEAAWNAADGPAFAAAFTDDADFIHILGGYYTGRAAIETGHRMILGTIYKGSTVHYSVEKIRFVRPDVALIFVRQHLEFFENGEPRELDARPTVIAEKIDGQWKIVAMQNTRLSEAGGAAVDRALEQHPYQV